MRVLVRKIRGGFVNLKTVQLSNQGRETCTEKKNGIVESLYLDERGR